MLNRPEGSPPATELHATLIGRDGSAVGLEGKARSDGADRGLPPRHALAFV